MNDDSGMDPEYIPRAAEAAWSGLSGFKDVTLHGFVVDANRARLDELLQRYIDRPSQELGRRIDVTPAFGRVLLLFIESVRFQLPPTLPTGQRKSQGAHYEKLFAVVVFGKQRRAKPSLFTFAPYVYTSQTPGWRMEREIFGYPQQLGHASISPDPQSPDPNSPLPQRLDLRADGMEHFAPDATSTDSPILSLEKKRDANEMPLSWDQLVRSLVRALSQAPGPTTRQRHSPRHRPTASIPRFGITAADASFMKHRAREAQDGDQAEVESSEDLSPNELSNALLAGSLRMLFLKQFRDIVYADRACYQAIVEAPLTMGGYGRAIGSHGYQLMLNDLDSAPIGRELGVPIGASNVALAFRVHLENMEIGGRLTPGTVISNPFWNPATETASPEVYPRLPRYVDRGGEAVWRQPSFLHGARIYGFGIRVPLKDQLCVLNYYVNQVVERSHASYGPDPNKKFRLVPCSGLGVVMLMFVEYDKVTSGDDDDGRLGGVRYREFLTMQLALCDDPEFPELDWLIPFIYLDKDSPRLGGREIYGYPKQLGDIPEFTPFKIRGVEIQPAQKLELRGLVIPKESVQEAESKAIVTIEARQPPATIKPYGEASDLILDLLGVSVPSSMTGPLTGHLFPADIAGLENAVSGSRGVNALEALLSGAVGHVFLKQFRDCARPMTACYQAVCKTDTVPGRFRGGARIDPRDYRITISDFASEPLLTYLGRDSQDARGPITPDFAYWMDLDIELTTGRVIANALEPRIVSTRTSVRPGQEGPGRQVRRSREPNL